MSRNIDKLPRNLRKYRYFMSRPFYNRYTLSGPKRYVFYGTGPWPFYCGSCIVNTDEEALSAFKDWLPEPCTVKKALITGRGGRSIELYVAY